MAENTRILLQRQSEGVPVPDDFEVSTASIPEPGDGELLCETIYLSLDPYLRGKISGRHLSGAILPGDLMAGEAISRVLKSNSPEFGEGDIVAAHTGWQAYSTPSAADVRRIDPSLGPLSTFLGVLGMPGLTAYAGLLRLGEPKDGDVLLVSAASGAVGSMVGQIGMIKGCRAVGIAGAPEKCEWVRNVAGFADVVSYKTGDLRESLDAAAPDGIDLYFDNVGGETLQVAMERLRLGARVVLCGLMAQYNTDGMPPGPNPAWIIKARATVRGMVVYDHEDLRETFVKDVSGWLREGRIHYLEDRTEGLENAADAFCRLMRGENIGKSIVVASNE